MIATAELKFPPEAKGRPNPNLSKPTKQFIADLMVRDPAKRLGGAVADASDVQAHAFFQGVDFGTGLRRLSELSETTETAMSGGEPFVGQVSACATPPKGPAAEPPEAVADEFAWFDQFVDPRASMALGSGGVPLS